MTQGQYRKSKQILFKCKFLSVEVLILCLSNKRLKKPIDGLKLKFLYKLHHAEISNLKMRNHLRHSFQKVNIAKNQKSNMSHTPTENKNTE
jgi:hypothetical protein